MAQSAVVGLLRVLLTANTAQFDSAMKSVADKAKGVSRNLNDVGRQAQHVGSALTKTFTLPIVAGFAASAKAAIDFESSFAGVRKTVNATEKEFGVLAQGMRNLAKTIPINVNELNKIGEAAGQLGIKTENILGFTEVMAKLGVTTNLSSEQAATSLARLANITQMPQENFDRLGSTIVALGNEFATTESEIVDFGTRIAGAGKIAGLTEHQILAIGAAMSSVGVQAEAGGTAVQKVLNDMTESVATGNEKLAVFAKTAGMSAQEFATAFRTDAGAAFAAFVAGLGREGDKAFTTLDNLKLGNERVTRAMLSLGGAGTLLTDTLRVGSQAWRDNTALTKEAEERFKTTHSQLTPLWNRVKDVGITIGNALLPAIQSAVGALNVALPIVDMLAKAFSALPGPVQMGALGFVGMVAAAGPLVFVFGQLAMSASALTGAFAAKGLATKLLTGNVGLLSGAYTLLLTPIRLNTVSVGLLSAAKVTLTTVTTALTGVVRTLWATLLAHPFVAVTAFIGAATLALTHFIEKRAQASLNAETEAAKQDTINLAIQRGAEATIKYADAIKYNQHWQAIRAAQFDKSAEAQQRAREAELAMLDTAVRLGRITQEQANLRRAQLQAEIQVANVRKSNVGLAETMALHEKKIRDEIEATGQTIPQLTAALKKNEAGFRAWAKEQNLSAEAIQFIQSQLKTTTAETKKAETAAEKYAKALEKQRDALQKLGIVTETTVNEALQEMGELVGHAAAAGVPLDRIYAALAPRLQELAKRAEASGTHVAGLHTALQDANDSALRLNTEGITKLLASLPAVQTSLGQLPGEVVKLDQAANVASLAAGLLTESYHRFGLKTRAELEKTARDSITHFNYLKASGTATPEEIAIAFDKMQADIAAAGGKITETTFKLRDAWISVLDQIGRATDGLVSAIATGLGRVVDGWFKAGEAVKQYAAQVGGATKAQKLAAVGGGIANVWGSTGAGGTAARTATGAAAGGAAGLAIAAAFAPATGGLSLLVPAIGAIGGAIVGLFRGMSANSKENKEATAGIKKIQAEWVNTLGSLEAVQAVGKALGHDITQIWSAEGKQGLEQFTAATEVLQARIEATRAEMTRLSTEGGVAGKTLLAFRDATRETAETLAFIRTETDASAKGIGAYLQAGATAYTKLAELQKAYADASENERAKIAADIKTQETLIASIGIASQEAATGLGAALAGAFGELQAQGVPLRQIIADLGPAVEAFKTQLQATGFAGGEAFDYIATLAGVASHEIAGPALDAINNLTRGLQGAHNAGFLTQEMFTGLTGQIMHSRKAILDQGVASDHVNALMQRDLQTIWQLQKDFNYQVDESTQVLLDEAEAAGTVGDKYRSAMDRAALAMERVAEALERAFGKARRFGDELDKIPRKVGIDVEFHAEDFPDMPSVSAGEAAHVATGGMVSAMGRIIPATHFAFGGVASRLGNMGERFMRFRPRGTDTVPAMLSPGELILNEGHQGNIGRTLQSAMDVMDRGVALASGATVAPSVTNETAVTNTYDVEVQVNVQPGGEFDPEQYEQIGLEIAKGIRRGGELRTKWGDEIVSVVKQAKVTA